MAYTDVDKHEGFVIRKLHSPDRTKTFGFLALPVDYDGKDNSLLRRFDTLVEAREYLHKPKPVSVITLPKTANPQNQKGYKAAGNTKK